MKRRSGFGWLELAVGVLLIVLGVLVFTKPDIALTSMIFAYGVAAVIMGIADIMLYIEVERYIGIGPVLSLISGILSVMSGVMLVACPGAGVIVLTVLFPIWFMAHCVSRLTHLEPHTLCGGKRGILLHHGHQYHWACPGIHNVFQAAADADDHPLPCRCLPYHAGHRQHSAGLQPRGQAPLRQAGPYPLLSAFHPHGKD